MCDVIANYL